MLHLSFVQDSKQFYLHLTATCEDRRVFTPVLLVLLETGGGGALSLNFHLQFQESLFLLLPAQELQN